MTVLSIDVGRKNLALCALQPGECAKGTQDAIRDWVVTTCDPTPHGIAVALNKLPWVTQCEEVVIERQPNRNPTMTRLQHYLEMYFVMHDKPVTVQDAKHKLAFAASTAWWDGEAAVNWSYHTRKKLAVSTMKAFLAATPQDPSFKKLFAESSKKDDLADSALQAMAFCHNVRPLEKAKRAMGTVRVKPRKPTAQQQATGKFSKPNIVYLLKGCPSLDAVKDTVSTNKHLHKSIERQFGGVDAPELLSSLGI